MTAAEKYCDRPWLIVVLVMGALIVSGCTPRQSPVEVSLETQVIHIASVGEPSELDPHIINAPPDFKIVPMLFEGLLIGDPATLEPRPGVAESWEVSDDGLTYTFHLRNNARWSNGAPVTASDFIYSWRRALTPELGSQYTFLFSAVSGADAFNTGELTDFSEVGFAAPNERTVVITLHQPTPYFLGILANNAIWSPVHPPTIEAAGGMAARGSGWTKPESMVCNGPFTLVDWRPNQRIELRRADTYWGASNVGPAGLVFHAFDSTEAEERAFRAGQLHQTQRVSTSKLQTYRDRSDSPLRETPSLVARFIYLNTSRPPLDDPRVRRALALALDRDALAEKVFRDVAVPARRIVPFGLTGYPADEDFTDDAKLARQQLADAGYPDGDGFPALVLSEESGSSSNLAEAIQEQWRVALGIKVELQRSETRVHWSRLQQGDYTIAIGGWIADYPDPTSFLDLWNSSSGWNFTGWTATDYDESLQQAAIAPSSSRPQALRDAESLLMQAMPIIPVVFENNPALIHPSLQGLELNPMDRFDYRPVRLVAP